MTLILCDERAKKMAEIDVIAIKENLPQVLGFVDRELEQSGCGMA